MGYRELKAYKEVVSERLVERREDKVERTGGVDIHARKQCSLQSSQIL